MKLHLQISGRPEERPVQAFASNGADQTFDERLRERRVRHRLHFLYVEDTSVRLPSVELEQAIMIGTQVLRWCLSTGRAVEHATQSHAIHRTAVHPKARDPTGALVHDHEHPMGAEDGRFAPKQINAPQAIFGMAEHREPRRPRRIWLRCGPHGKNPPHHILVHRKAEGQGDLLRDARSPQVGFRCFMSTMAAMTSRLGPFGPGLFCSVDENS